MRERSPVGPAALLAWGALSLCPAAGQEPLHVGHVSVHATDVFGPEESSLGFLYRGANALHVITRESTIRRFLLFEEGDPYDPEVLAESERTLRALGLFRSVSIVAGEPRDGDVDVEVLTQDAWTVQIGLAAGSGGGAARGGVTLGEANFLGTATRLSVGFAQDQFRTYRAIEVLTPNFFLPFATAHLRYATNSDGSEKVLELSRPFYATAAPWGAQLGVADVRRGEFLYEEGGAVRATYKAAHFHLALTYGRALSSDDVNASRLSVGLDWREDRFSPAAAPATPAADVLPEDRRFHSLFLQYEVLHADFLKWNFINHDERLEDIGLGPHLALRLGVSPRAFGSPETTGLVGVEVGVGARAGPDGYWQARGQWDARVGHNLENSILAASLAYVHRFDTAPRQTFVAQVAGLRGWNLDRDVQIFADAQAGLRGYRLEAFEGNGRVVVNVEHRIFSGWQLFHLVSPGLAVFFDAGLVGGPERPIRLSGVAMDAGVGLRLAMAWAPVMNVFRLDAAYAFQRDPAGRRGWLISFATGQAF